MSQFFGCSLPDCCAILLTFRCTVLVTMLHSCYSLTPSSEMQSLSANLSLISSLRSIGGAQQENEAHLFTYDSRGSLLPGTPQGISSMQSKIRGILEEVMARMGPAKWKSKTRLLNCPWRNLRRRLRRVQSEEQKRMG
jgi:hypothetical protein